MYSSWYYIDSWIELSSQPSSSSLSSAATTDDIITTGLRVDRESVTHHRSRRRRLQRLAAVTTAQVDYSPREPSLASSSQDEYDESESESDRVLSSSNEDLNDQTLGDPFLVHTTARAAAPTMSSALDADCSSDEEDDNSTALGMRISSSPFVPQPNAFSHPPASQDPSWTRATESHQSHPSFLSSSSRRTAIRHHSNTGSVRSSRRQPRQQQQQQHSPYNMISPSHHTDHDAALRASLSTLLSCAAAARGLPKHDSTQQRRQQQQQAPMIGPPRAHPASFRLVSESVVMGEEEEEEEGEEVVSEPGPFMNNSPPSIRHLHTQPAGHEHPVSRRPHASSPAPKAKHRSSASKDRFVAHAAARKSRRASLTESASNASPTLMTWVISAGVVVLFSAISFSAGYIIGREVGRAEAAPGMMGVPGLGDGASGARASASCGREAVQGGLKRLRWGSAAAAGSSIIA
ncbi:hypothetical protein ASPZODRAFT_130121 [Penicilliopsis zonata CBS 506.65]|uniref:Uncharacterized protein n=1 Tax=Penicilliopsis zonata CBS 506.65 TaxID=1073090 RepID=A0A1L9SM16_9EURO|nr:hypothetical protein ASPZODRAFT_130121 [Penicilliopsis zonata CBS 506.65]OJJ48173.1 hypothetical protein ASPZODRAFT_130121 [Penicilliopsis zonata CBS 506.65]